MLYLTLVTCPLPGEQTYQVKKKTWDDVVPMSKREAITMAKYPDAHKPEKPRPLPIEREDWPAPPDPAAAYPELCMYYKYIILYRIIILFK